MTALERAARAVNEATCGEFSPCRCLSIARAVLMAVREPGMSVWIDADCSDDTHPVDIFTAMIDAILNEKDTTND